MMKGIPTCCHTFKSGGEACEWPVMWAPNSVGTITMNFDPKGVACQWSYKDAYIEKRSAQQCHGPILPVWPTRHTHFLTILDDPTALRHQPRG